MHLHRMYFPRRLFILLNRLLPRVVSPSVHDDHRPVINKSYSRLSSFFLSLFFLLFNLTTSYLSDYVSKIRHLCLYTSIYIDLFIFFLYSFSPLTLIYVSTFVFQGIPFQLLQYSRTLLPIPFPLFSSFKP